MSSVRGIHHPEADFLLVGVFLEDFHLASPRRGAFQHQLVNVHLDKVGKHGPVVTCEEHIFPPAPVAAADVDTGLDSGDSLRGLVHQPHRKLKFVGGVPAVRQGSTHEGLGAFLSEDHLAEDGFVQLNEVAALITQGDYLFPENGHNVAAKSSGSGYTWSERPSNQLERVNI